ncbi:hypothetical protein D3C83_103130 [compost metagenome]
MKAERSERLSRQPAIYTESCPLKARIPLRTFSRQLGLPTLSNMMKVWFGEFLARTSSKTEFFTCSMETTFHAL